MDFSDFSQFALPISFFLGLGFFFDRILNTSEIALPAESSATIDFNQRFFDFGDQVYRLLFSTYLSTKQGSGRYLLKLSAISLAAYFGVSAYYILAHGEARQFKYDAIQAAIIIYFGLFNVMFDTITIKLARSVFDNFKTTFSIRLLFLQAYTNFVILIMGFITVGPIALVVLGLAFGNYFNHFSERTMRIDYRITEIAPSGADIFRYKISTLLPEQVEPKLPDGRTNMIAFSSPSKLGSFDTLIRLDHVFEEGSVEYVKISLGNTSLDEIEIYPGDFDNVDNFYTAARTRVSQALQGAETNEVLVSVQGRISKLVDISSAHSVFKQASLAYRMIGNLPRIFHEGWFFNTGYELFFDLGFRPFIGSSVCTDRSIYIIEGVYASRQRNEDCKTIGTDAIGTLAGVDTFYVNSRLLRDYYFPLNNVVISSAFLVLASYFGFVFFIFSYSIGAIIKPFSRRLFVVFMRAPCSTAGLCIGLGFAVLL